jgi:hypothetical protein
LTAADGEVDLDVVIAEIYDAVAQRRASGELPADLEAELDAEFANYAPSAVTGDSLSGVLSQADKAVTIDVDAPTAGKFPAGQVKKGVRKLTFWYMQYLANQVSSFGSATVRALRMLDRRVSIVEQSTPGASRAVASALEAMDPVPVPAPTAEVIADQLRGAKGRVLHAECGEGDLVRHLAQAGFDVYGVEPRRRLLAPALREGLEIRPDGATDHLTSIAPGALSALVLSGLDTKPTGAQVHLADLAARAIESGGCLVVLGSQPEAWSAAVPVVIADLAPGRPLHAETWASVLEGKGFDVTSVVDVASAPEVPGYAVVARRR